jgi:hypothetical protein
MNVGGGCVVMAKGSRVEGWLLHVAVLRGRALGEVTGTQDSDLISGSIH